jgi:hypothetical protein
MAQKWLLLRPEREPAFPQSEPLARKGPRNNDPGRSSCPKLELDWS